jgi:signal transduction histidine kinase
VKVSVFDLRVFINELVEEMNLQLRPHQRIEVSLQGDLQFATDKRLLKNALLNVLSNAIKFSPDAPLIALEIKDTLVGKSIGVIDHGMGVPVADQAHLFSSFFRASNVADIQGTGLGLLLVRRYVHLIGGTVDFKSELGTGTTVTLDLPRLEVL